MRLLAGIAIATSAAALPGMALAAGPTPPADRQEGTIQLAASFPWSSSTRQCVTDRRGSAGCFNAELQIPGVGLFQYARDAVATGDFTDDGCPEYTTEGTIWVDGGSATFKGVPLPTCGGADRPDAHYAYTVTGGTGRLAGATGSGEILADHGKDVWTGTLVAPGLASKLASAGGNETAALVGGAGGAGVLLAIGGALLWRRRRQAVGASDGVASPNAASSMVPDGESR